MFTRPGGTNYDPAQLGLALLRARNLGDLNSVPTALGNLGFRFINALDYGVTGGGSADDTPGLQAAITASISADAPLFLPAGNYRTTEPLIADVVSSFRWFGDGAGLTNIIPDSFTGNVIEIRPDGTTGGWTDNQVLVQDIRVINPTYISGYRSGQNAIYVSPVDGNSGVVLENIISLGFEVGFYLYETQFCVYRSCVASRGLVGAYLKAGVIGGGGNNNTFYDCFFSFNSAGFVARSNGGVTPFHNNKFINLVTHGNSVCGFYLKDGDAFSIENWAPEINGTGAATLLFDGLTIKNGNLAVDRGVVVLRNYNHVSNTAKIVADNYSCVTIDGGFTSEFHTDIDSTSILNFTDSVLRLYQGDGDTVAANTPAFATNASQMTLVAVPKLVEAPWLANDAIETMGKNVEYGQAGAGTACTNAYVTDPTMGYVTKFTFPILANAGVIYTWNAFYTGIGTPVIVSFLAKSSSSTAEFALNFAESTASMTLKIPADRWVRVIMYGVLSVASRSPYITVVAQASALNESLSFCKVHSCQSLPANTLSAFIREGLYNPGIFKARNFTLSASPVVGTWAVGDIVWNSAPVPGGTIGWVCTTAPLTFKAFGDIAP
jgi:hypothetical protein